MTDERAPSRFGNVFSGRAAAAVVVAVVAIGLGMAALIDREPPVGTAPLGSVSPSAMGSASPSAGVGRIAFQANRSNDTSGIYLMGADGSNVVALVDDPAVHEMDPVWSPDGSLVAYITMPADGAMRGGTFIVDAQGGEPILVDANYAYGPGTWSPDGSMLAVGGDGSQRGIGVYQVADGRFAQMTDDGGTAPRWSPDGTRIAYDIARPSDIGIVDVASGEVGRLTNDDWNDSVARWANDGDRIVFSSDRETDQSKTSFRSWVVDADGGEPELLGDGQLIAFAHWPSPDGDWIAYAAPDGSGLRISRADGSEDRVVFPGTPADGGSSWAADSSGFAFSNVGEDPRDIYVMSVDADEPVRITDHPADESAPNWGPPET